MNSYRYQFHFSRIPALTSIFGKVTFGSSGAVSSYSGNGVYQVSKLATGIYQAQLTDNFNSLLNANFSLESPTTGSAVTAGSFVTGTLYQITSLGNTSWSAIGLNAGLTPTVGQLFVATGVGSGTGTATAIGETGISVIEVPPAGTMLQNQTPGQGAIVIFQTLAATNSTTTTLIPASPASGSSIRFTMTFNNSYLSA